MKFGCNGRPKVPMISFKGGAKPGLCGVPSADGAGLRMRVELGAVDDGS